MKDLYQRYADLQLALKLWLRSGKQGTAPRKVRANSNETKQISRDLRVKRDRVNRKITKRLQRNRLSKGKNVRTGR